MRILVTGASGFVGRWLAAELTDAGHEVVAIDGATDLDVTDAPAVRARVTSARPDAVAHLAAMSFGPDAQRDPERALAVNEGGARNVLEAAAASRPAVPVLLVSSAEVYGRPDPADLPLREDAALAALRPYGRSKIAAERAATDVATTSGVPLVIARPFNHTGPGQRLDFVVPALASRIVAALEQGDPTIAAGNVDVRRDIGDVRDVVRAYRLLLERAVDRGSNAAKPLVVNVATGRSVAIRDVIGALARLAGTAVTIRTDPALVRPDDPPDVRGDASRLAGLTGWRPQVPLETTLADVLDDVRARSGAAGPGR